MNDTKESEAPKAPDYEKLAADQQSQLDALLEQKKAGASAQLDLSIKRKRDTVRHIRNLAAGNPKERARAAALTAKRLVLDRIIARDPD